MSSCDAGLHHSKPCQSKTERGERGVRKSLGLGQGENTRMSHSCVRSAEDSALTSARLVASQESTACMFTKLTIKNEEELCY